MMCVFFFHSNHAQDIHRLCVRGEIKSYFFFMGIPKKFKTISLIHVCGGIGK